MIDQFVYCKCEQYNITYHTYEFDIETEYCFFEAMINNIYNC